MPRSKPSKTEELRITLGTKERMMFDEFLTSYRIKSIFGDDGIMDDLADFGKVLAVAATLGGLLELFGITDIFDFDDDVKAMVLPTKESIKKRQEFNQQQNELVVNFFKDFLRPFQS